MEAEIEWIDDGAYSGTGMGLLEFAGMRRVVVLI